jgi:hypothetical protein
MRLVFVADSIPPELQRIVEFLNVQMDPAEVVAVEIRQYVGQGRTTLVPRVIGQTAEAQQKKTRRTSAAQQWDEASFFQALGARYGTEGVETARTLLTWGREKTQQVWWGRGSRNGSFFPLFEHPLGQWHWLFAVWTHGRVEIQFSVMQRKPPFDEETKRLELLERLNALDGVEFAPDVITKQPGIPLSALREPLACQQFLAIFDWVVQEIRGRVS